MKKLLCLVTLLMSFNSVADSDMTEIIVSHPPGGVTDSLGRIVSQAIVKSGGSAIVINKPGANSTIAANYVAQAPKTGKILLIGATGSIDANMVYNTPNTHYNESSFDPIISLGTMSFVLSVPADSNIKNYAEYTAYIKQHPDQFTVGFWNAGMANIFYAWAEKEQLPRPTIAIYKGSSTQIIDLLGHHVFSTWDTWVAIKPQVDSKKIRVIAVLDSHGIANIQKNQPGTTLFSVGNKYPELDIRISSGLYAPKDTPKSVIDDLNKNLNIVFRTPEFKEKFKLLTLENYGGSPAELSLMRFDSLNKLKKMKYKQ